MHRRRLVVLRIAIGIAADQACKWWAWRHASGPAGVRLTPRHLSPMNALCAIALVPTH
jgi:hypothetical protein